MNADASNPALHFGREVQRARVAAGMTLAEMGRVVGYHKSQVSRVERGVRAPTKKFAQMCDLAFPQRRRMVSPLLRGQPAVVGDAAVVPQLDRARATCGQPANLATLVTVGAGADRGVRTGATAKRAGATAGESRNAYQPESRGNSSSPVKQAAPMVWFLIDEAALRRLTGSPLIMADQLERLLTVTKLSNVTVR